MLKQLSDMRRVSTLLILPVLAAILWVLIYLVPNMDSTAIAVCFAAAIVFTGIPHGALDIDILARRLGRLDWSGKLQITALYLLGVGAMAALWFTAPAIALSGFLIISILHFGMDWRHLPEPFFGCMAGWAIISLPALSHPDAVADIFSALVGPQSAASITAVLGSSAVPAALISTVFCIDAITKRDLYTAVTVATCLIAAIALPPLASFALFFCCLHSPKHFREALTEAGQLNPILQALTVIAVVGLATGIGALLFVQQSTLAVDDGLISTTFMLLSILTLPHFCLELFLTRQTDELQQKD